MKPRTLCAVSLALVIALIPSSVNVQGNDRGAVRVPLGEKQRGVSWVAGDKITPDHIKPLEAANVEWIVQTPFGWQQRYDSPKIALVTGGHVLWGETDEGLRLTRSSRRNSASKRWSESRHATASPFCSPSRVTSQRVTPRSDRGNGRNTARETTST